MCVFTQMPTHSAQGDCLAQW